jgi:hypothetical protein
MENKFRLCLILLNRRKFTGGKATEGGSLSDRQAHHAGNSYVNGWAMAKTSMAETS